MLEDGVFVRGDWIKDKKNQATAVKFLTASLKGWAYCRDNVESWYPSGNPIGKGNVVRNNCIGGGGYDRGVYGDAIWQDKANNLVWMRFQGGMSLSPVTKLVANSNEDLYRGYSVVRHDLTRDPLPRADVKQLPGPLAA